MPLMVTGGFRTREGMEQAMQDDGIDVIGLGRPLCTDPNVPKRLLAGESGRLPSFERELRWGPGIFGPTSKVFVFKLVNVLGQQGWYYQQIARRGDGLKPALELGVVSALLRYLGDEQVTAWRMRRVRRLTS